MQAYTLKKMILLKHYHCRVVIVINKLFSQHVAVMQ